MKLPLIEEERLFKATTGLGMLGKCGVNKSLHSFEKNPPLISNVRASRMAPKILSTTLQPFAHVFISVFESDLTTFGTGGVTVTIGFPTASFDALISILEVQSTYPVAHAIAVQNPISFEAVFFTNKCPEKSILTLSWLDDRLTDTLLTY